MSPILMECKPLCRYVLRDDSVLSMLQPDMSIPMKTTLLHNGNPALHLALTKLLSALHVEIEAFRLQVIFSRFTGCPEHIEPTLREASFACQSLGRGSFQEDLDNYIVTALIHGRFWLRLRLRTR